MGEGGNFPLFSCRRKVAPSPVLRNSRRGFRCLPSARGHPVQGKESAYLSRLLGAGRTALQKGADPGQEAPDSSDTPFPTSKQVVPLQPGCKGAAAGAMGGGGALAKA